jgi:uncharacterized protein involved in outer membrane biogenesis
MRWKWFLIIPAVLLLVLIIAAFVILSSYDFNKLKPEISKAAFDATGRELTLGGDIDLDIGFTPALVVEDVSLENADWGSRPQMVTIKRFEVQVAILPLFGGNVEVKRLILIEPDILVEKDLKGRSNLEFKAPKKKAAPSAEEAPSGEEVKLPRLAFRVRVEDGLFTLRDLAGPTTHEVKLETLSADARGADTPVELSLKGEVAGKPFAIEGTLGPVSAMLDKAADWPLDLSISAAGATLGLDGRIKDLLAQRGIDMGFVLAVKDLEDLEELAGKPLPVKGPLEVSGRASDLGRKSYKVADVNVAVAGSDVKGSMEVNLGGKRPRLNVTLNSERLDLRPLIGEGKAPSDEGDDKGAGEKRERVFSSEPLPLDSLKAVDADVKLRAAKVLLPRLALSALAVDLHLKDGSLSLRPLKAHAGGGKLDGRIELRARGASSRLAAAVTVDGLDLGEMLKDLEVTDLLEGKLDAGLDLRGEGGSIAALMAGLNGNTTVVMGKGRLDNKYIDLLGGDLTTGVFRLLNPGAGDEKYTNVNCFVSRTDVRNGLADTTALVFDTSFMSVVGDGTVNLKNERLDLSLKPSPKKGIETGGGKLSLSLGELAKPFKLGGTLANPSLGLDPTASALLIGKGVGGGMLLGPAGIASALVTGTADEDENPCVAALEAAKTGKRPAKKPSEEKKSPVDTTTEGVKESVEGIGEGLKKLFGK